MTATLSPAGIPTLGPTRALSTGELIGWVTACLAAVLLCHAALLWRGGVPAEAFNAVEIIALGCIIALLRRDRAPRAASAGQVASLALLSAGALFAPGTMGSVAFIPLGLHVLFAPGWSDNQRRAGAVFVAIGTRHLLASLVPLLIGDTVLRLDTAAAGFAMQLFVPGASWSGNVLKPPGDVGITVYMACSSFANLSSVALCFASLHALDGGRPNRRAAAVLFGICAVMILANTARLVVIARSLEGFTYWHDGSGAQLFGIASTLVTVALCSSGSRWAARAD